MIKRVLLAAACIAAAILPARADVIIDPHLSGTGDNVVFESLTGNIAVGRFNGQHQGLVDFTDLSGNPLFTGASNGNDIKIANTSNLQVQVFANNGVDVLQTLTDVFSLKGTGHVTAFAYATDGIFQFDLGTINNSQSGFTLSAINGETISKFVLLDVGGTITDFEHYRIDVGPTVGVPGPVVGAGIPGLVSAFSIGMVALNRRRKRRQLNA